MAWRRAGIVGLVVLGLGLWWLRSGEENSGASEAPAANESARDRVDLRRAQKDLGGLAKAFSMVAARTIGLVMVNGRVLDRNTGMPIAHAEVVFSGPAGESSVQCDERGAYEVELEPGFYRSYARADGYVAVAPAAAQRLPGPVSAAAVAMPREGIAPLAGLFRDQIGVDLVLSPGAILRGRVVDTEGNGISGAIVSAKAQGGLRVISGSDVSESDGSGQYQLLIPSGSAELEARHENYAALRDDNRVYIGPAQEQERTLVMSAGCIIEGSVIDAEGRPVLAGSFEKHLGGGRYTPIGEIEAGKVRYASAREETVVLRAWAWKHPPTVSQEFRCLDGEHYRDLSFVVPEAEPVLSGYVEGDSGQRARFAFIDLFSLEPGGATQQERADENGDFAFFDLPEGAYQLSVYVPGKGATIELIDVPSSGVPLRLGGTGSIIGSVTGPQTGALTMRYRCAFRLTEEESARGDELSMPVQTLLVPLDRGRFRVDDLPACPLEGIVSGPGLQKSFAIEVQPDREVTLRIE